jgi:hypothetical protein
MLALAALTAGAACSKPIRPATVQDVQIAARVKTALVNDTTVGIYAVEVRVANGVVMLSGRLPSEALVARAIEIARGVPGVAEVRSDLIVGGAMPATASAVALPASEPALDDEDLDPRTRHRLLAIGGSIAWQASRGRSLADQLSVGPIFRFGAGSGFGLAIGLGWFGAELRASGSDEPIGRIRIRPIMAGVRYTMRTLASSTSVSFVAGPALNGMSSADRLGAGELAVDAANSFAWRPGVSTWFDLSSRAAFNLSAGYVITRPQLTLIDDGQVVRRRLVADTLIVRAGLAYKIF